MAMRDKLSDVERIYRQKVMTTFKHWMNENSVSRAFIAERLGITVGHLSTLLNANRNATANQASTAESFMKNGASRFLPSSAIKMPRVKSPRKHRAVGDSPNSTHRKLRPLTPQETSFVVDVVEKLILDQKKKMSVDALVDVIKALSVGIRS